VVLQVPPSLFRLTVQLICLPPYPEALSPRALIAPWSTISNIIEMTDQLQECGGLVLSVANALNCLIPEFRCDGHTSGRHGHHQGDEHVTIMRRLECPA